MLNRLPNQYGFFCDSFPTPLIGIRIAENDPLIWCKLEFLHPSGSTKDRIARWILEKAWREGLIRTGSLVVEASSGSTSIAMALTCAQMKLNFLAVMPEGVSRERILMIHSFGAQVMLTPKSEGMVGALKKAEEISKEKAAYYCRQFENPDNIMAHKIGTGREIVMQIPGGGADAVVSGVGTGGTIMGLSQAFHDHGCRVKAFVARPTSNNFFGGVECCSFSQKIPGVLDGYSRLYVPEENPDIEQIAVEETFAIHMTKVLLQKGFPVGPSSGLNYAASVEVARRIGPKAQVVTVFPDRVERYFSTELFA
jgi:cysteine synthase